MLTGVGPLVYPMVTAMPLTSVKNVFKLILDAHFTYLQLNTSLKKKSLFS